MFAVRFWCCCLILLGLFVLLMCCVCSVPQIDFIQVVEYTGVFILGAGVCVLCLLHDAFVFDCLVLR